MTTITLYHATNVPVSKIGIEKQTMFFTSNRDAAKEWGDEHYDRYDILEVEMPIEDVYEFIPARPQFDIYDFERLEVQPEKIEGKCVHYADCCDGYIVKNINDYTIR